MRPIILFLATGLGSGYSPKAPGTMGSLIGLLMLWLLKLAQGERWWLLALLIPLGIWLAQQAEHSLGEHDSPKIVIDEIVGIFISGYLLPINYLPVVFVLFRFFDIVKPGPISTVQRLPGGWGIMADDILAGLTVQFILTMIIFYIA